MATTFRTLTTNDIVKSRTRLHEYIPITGSILSGSIYGVRNVKTFSHGLYESIYDYPHLSSSANHIMDVSFGVYTASVAHTIQRSEKGRIYQLYSQVLMGFQHDPTQGSLVAAQNYGIQFDEDGNIAAGGTKLNECYFVNFSRLLVKDEIKKGTFNMTLGIGRLHDSPFTASALISDTSTAGKGRTKVYDAANQFRTNATVGEYGFLYMTASTLAIPDLIVQANLDKPVGLIFYQPGIMVLTASIFNDNFFTANKIEHSTLQLTSSVTHIDSIRNGTIQNLARGFRNRIRNITFNNTVELNSTVYMCRAQLNDYNYSSNPTYISGSKIVVKNERGDQPVSYVSGIGLYSSDNELLAVAKTSEPLRKDPSSELTMRVRLDY